MASPSQPSKQGSFLKTKWKKFTQRSPSSNTATPPLHGASILTTVTSNTVTQNNTTISPLPGSPAIVAIPNSSPSVAPTANGSTTQSSGPSAANVPAASSISPAAVSNATVNSTSATLATVSSNNLTILPSVGSSLSQPNLPVDPAHLQDLVKRLRNDIMENAIKLLPLKVQAVIRASQKSPAETELISCRDAAQKKHEQWKQLQWTRISKRAAKVVQWIDRFKSVMDVAASADPIHAGLPWAGIRFLLTIAMSSVNQTLAFVDGLDLALSKVSQLDVYRTRLEDIVILQNANLEDERKIFQEILTKNYSLLLNLFASAIEEYSKHPAKRVMHAAFWPSEVFQNFKDAWSTSTHELANVARVCEGALQSVRWDGLQQWQQTLTSQLAQLDRLSSIRFDALFTELSHRFETLEATVKEQRLDEQLHGLLVPGAFYNSNSERTHPLCLEGTRADLLQQVIQWSQEDQAVLIFWLCGGAGTGKSTVARTIASRVDVQQQLGANFFFKRGEGDRSSATKFLMSFAAQIAVRIPELRPLIAKALEKPTVLFENPKRLFDSLILQPLQSLAGVLFKGQLTIVLDALDECEDTDHVRDVLQCLTYLHEVDAVQFRVFITSRSESRIQARFKSMPASLHTTVILEDVQAITNDMRLFFTARFKEIVEESNGWDSNQLAIDWPGKESVDDLAQLASPLFIFAETVCRWLSESDEIEDRLKLVLAPPRHADAHRALAAMYDLVLSQLFSERPQTILINRSEILFNFKSIVGPIVLLKDSLSQESLASLLGVNRRRVGSTLDPLHSVISVSSEPDAPVRLLHASFREHLTDINRSSEELYVDSAVTHRLLFDRCLKCLRSERALKKNLLGVKEPGWRRQQSTKTDVERALPAHIAYACRNWTHHYMNSSQDSSISDGDDVEQFLQGYFLYWLEALIWLGEIYSVKSQISALLSRVNNSTGSQAKALLEDAQRFIARFQNAIDTAPLQLYSSALNFAPRSSVVRKRFHHAQDTFLRLMFQAEQEWGIEQQTLEGHEQSVSAVTFAPENQGILASGSYDCTVRLWNIVTGELIRTLTGHEGGVLALAFSPDRNGPLASGSQDKTVRLWNIKDGVELFKFEGHTGDVCALTFLKPGLLSSASEDHTIHTWNFTNSHMANNREWKRSGAHLGTIHALAYCSKTQRLASGDSGNKVRVWNSTTGQDICSLGGHEDPVLSVAFSSTGELASGSMDRTVRVWNIDKRQQTKVLDCDGNRIDTVKFLDEDSLGKRLAAASRRGSVRVWQMPSYDLVFQFEGYAQWGTLRSIAFSSTNELALGTVAGTSLTLNMAQLMLAKPADDEEIHLLLENTTSSSQESADLQLCRTEEMNDQLVPTEHLEGSVEIMEFSSDGTMAAVGTALGEIRIWSLETGRPLCTLRSEHQQFEITALKFSDDGHMIVSGSCDATIVLWDSRKGEQIHALRAPELSWSWPDNITDDEQPTFEVTKDKIRLMALTCSGRILATASDKIHVKFKRAEWGVPQEIEDIGAVVRLWDTVTGRELQTLDGLDEEISSLAFSHDEQMLAFGYFEGPAIRLWSIAQNQPLANLSGHESWVKNLAFAPNDEILASASSDDGTVILWDITKHEQMYVLEQDSEDLITTLAFSPDGSLLATGGNCVRVGSTEDGTWLRCFEGVWAFHNLSFTGDSASLLADGRMFPVRPRISDAPAQSQSYPQGVAWHALRVDPWLQCDDKDLLWLPWEVRQENMAHFPGHPEGLYGNVIWMLKANGDILFFKVSEELDGYLEAASGEVNCVAVPKSLTA